MIAAVAPFVRKEIREILRDRRTILLAFLVPIFVYPLTFSFSSFLERSEEDRIEELVHRVAVSGDAARVVAALREDERLEVVEAPAGAADSLRAAIGSKELAAWVDVGDTLRVSFYAARDESREARDRIREALDAVRREETERRFREAGGGGPLGDPVGLREVDVASGVEAAGAKAGRLVPFLLVMTLFIGGSALSTDIVAGEKERGTLETLYLTPVERSVIARAKFLVVAGATIVSGVLNLGSMVYCYRMGWIGDGDGLVLSAPGLATAFGLIVPLGALIGGLLLGISAFARSLKEAQYYLTPTMLVAFLPGLLATSQDVALGPVTALIPVANVALAIRDGLVGPVPSGLLALVAIASIGWGLVTMRWTAGVLSREETILGFDPEPFLSRTPAGRHRAALLGMAATVLGFFYLGQWIQARSLVPGLILSLWILLPALAAGTLRIAWSGGRLAEVLSLRRPGAGALLGGALLGLGAVYPMFEGIARLQSLVLPMPEGFVEGFDSAFDSLPTAALLFLLAISPGICEELVFRGAFLGLLDRVTTGRRAVVVSSAFFALIHLSVFRFLPTFLIGLLFAVAVRRSRSIFPAMVAHAAYNGLGLLGTAEGGLLETLGPAGGWGASAAALALGGWLLRGRSAARADEPSRPVGGPPAASPPGAGA